MSIIKHGRSKESFGVYNVWKNMKARCLNKNRNHYDKYGGRGIKVCDRWLTFENFLADMGEKPDDMTLDRIDVNGNYEPSNCRWATLRQQGNNTRVNVYIKYKGELYTEAELSRETGINRTTIQQRRREGWTDFEIVNGRHLAKNSELFEVRGKIYTQKELSTEYNINTTTINYRIKAGKFGEDLIRQTK